MIITCYSYKGGVGRSMALANIAELLYRRGLSVLMIDFDLEAPGLEQYFYKKDSQPLKKALSQRGIIDLLLSYKELRSLPLPQNSPKDEKEIAESKEEDSTPVEPPPADEIFPYAVEPLDNFIWKIHPRSSRNPGELLLLPAGRRVREIAAPDGQPSEFKDEFAAYANNVRSFAWDDFYLNQDGEDFFNWFYEKAIKRAEVVLIDSRTGVAEMSGVCTYQLADVVMMFVAPNNQNVDGTSKIASSLVGREDLIRKRYKQRKLSVLLVPSRVDSNEKEKMDDLANRFREIASRLSSPDLTFETDTFTDLTIPYIAYYSFVEELAVSDSASTVAGNLKRAYENICRTLAQLDPAINAKWLEEGETSSKINVAERQDRLAERAYSKLNEDEKALAYSLFTRLVRLALPEEGERKDTPKDVKLADLSPEQKSLAEALEKEKLLVLAKDAAGQDTVGLAEDELIQNWHRFNQWIDKDRDFLIWRQKMQGSLSDWEKAGRDKSLLLQNLGYVEEKNWLDSHRRELNEAESEYIKASFEQARRRRLQRYTKAAGLISMVLIIGVLLYSYLQWRSNNSTEKVRSRKLASDSEALVTIQPELSMLLAVEALRLAPTTEADRALKNALQQSHLRTVMRIGAPVYRARYSRDGKRIVTTSGDEGNSVAQIWQPGDGNNWPNLFTLRGFKGRVTAAVFSPDDRLIATSSYDGTAILWDAASGQVVGTRPEITNQSLYDLDWSPDGTLVATANMADNLVYVWDAKTQQVFKTLKGFSSDAMSVSFSPDGKYLAAGSRDKQVRIWNAKTWEEVRAPLIEHVGEVWSVRFSQDSKFLVTAGADSTARVWETSGWQTVAVLSGHTNSINRASFSPDGRLVVTASEDGTAIIWEVATGNRVTVLRGSLKSGYDASFSQDGKLILTASADGTARLWELNVEINPNITGTELTSMACTRVTRNMTEEEWRQYMGTDAYRLTCPDIRPLQPAQTPAPAATPTLQPSTSLKRETSGASQKKS